MEGLRELDKALAEMSKATARNVLKRALIKAAEPIADKARQLVPKDTHALERSIIASSKLANPVGKAEYAAAMKAGKGKSAAAGAMREARREAGGEFFAEISVGPGQLPHAHLVEFGSSKMAAQPYLRPAWDAHKVDALDAISGELKSEIDRAAKRAAQKAAKLKTKTA